MLLAETEIAAAGIIAITRTYRDGESGQVLDTFAPGQLVKVHVGSFQHVPLVVA